MSTLRISGLASGMDVDSMVKEMMKAQRLPLDKLNQKKQILEWQRDDYRSMNTLLSTLKDLTFSMKLTSSYRSRTVTSSDESKVTATASSAANQASYNISSVEKLASAATKVNGGSLSKSASDKIDANAGLYDQMAKFASYADSTSTGFDWKQGSIEKESINVTSATDTLQLKQANLDSSLLSSSIIKVNGKDFQVVDLFTDQKTPGQVMVGQDGKLTFSEQLAANSSVSVTYFTPDHTDTFTASGETKDFQLTKSSIAQGSLSSVSVEKADGTKDTYNIVTDKSLLTSGSNNVYVDEKTGKLSFADNIEKDAKVSATYKENFFTFGIQTFNTEGKAVNQTFAVNGATSLNTVINQINTSSVGVTAFYDTQTDRMTLTRSQTGNFNPAGDEIITSGAFLTSAARFDDPATESGGENAVFTVNGLRTERNANTFAMNGVTFTLKQTFDTGTVSLAVGNNADDVVKNIKNFVDKYNETISKIKDKVSEERYRSYQPLSDEERQGMTDKQAELWDEKAKSGLIKGDTVLNSALNEMRQNLYATVTDSSISSNYNQLAKIGITTSANYLEGGKLVLDEAKLKKAIEDDPSSVEKLFTATSSVSSENGLMQRMYDTLTKSINSVKDKAGSSLLVNNQFVIGKELNDLNSRIDAFNKRLTQIEDRYYSQFTAMEQAIQRSNQQSTYLSQFFNS
ncbi:flagellar filament capping protein FliD [Fictibacillus enclensis]|uniref:flagellar filament capping protein FliD n=1 Tax=Fictibacillus enclensis TaxID=1017270 RepID=UPI0025A0CBAC|nr:flagellar filament capping protein FliD [Fictibacillus enclensis]MDM5340062.1 flagellar filament capping protein FliD [Fictibacillus enclensis]